MSSVTLLRAGDMYDTNLSNVVEKGKYIFHFFLLYFLSQYGQLMTFCTVYASKISYLNPYSGSHRMTFCQIIAFICESAFCVQTSI